MQLQQFAQKFVKQNADALSKWHKYLASDLADMANFPIATELMPLANTSALNRIDAVQQKKLYYGFIRFQAEVIALFEDFLIGAWRWNRDQFSIAPAAAKFSGEELYHSLAFRHFLRQQPALNYPRQSLLLRSANRLRKVAHFIARRAPFAILIQGAKLETFSMYYSKMVVEHLTEDHPWQQINAMHLKDEAYHIPFGYEYFDDHIEHAAWLKRLRTLGYSVVFTAVCQLIMATASWRLVAEVFPQVSVFRRVVLCGRLIHWNLFDFGPYQQTRQHLKSYYNRRKFHYYRILRFIHCGGISG